MEISIVSPVYKGEMMVNALVNRIEAAVSTITADYEIILVNDCSPDNSWAKIKEVCATDPHVKGVNLSRNFGQHYAITAGLSKTSGEWVVVMDCDLQDMPEEIPHLYAKAQEGYDSVFAQRMIRQDKFLKRLSSIAYHTTYHFISGIKTDYTVANFGIYRRDVIQAVLSMGDSIRSFPTMVRWVGFRITKMPVHHSKRLEGSSSYSLVKLFRQAFDCIIGFTNRPLTLIVRFGFCIVLLSIVLTLYYLSLWLFRGVSVDGFTTIVISLWMLGGIMITILGIVGLYIGKVYDNTKQRPCFIISEVVNFDKSPNE